MRPRASGWHGAKDKPDLDLDLVGFGPHGTSGKHVFNPSHPIYTRIAQLTKVRQQFKPLRRGRQYPRPISYVQYAFALPASGQIIAWSRIFDDQEVLVVLNPNGAERRGARVVVDHRVSPEGMQIVANTDPTAPTDMRPGACVPVQTWDDWRYVSLDQWLLGASEVMVLANRSAIETAGLTWRGTP